jgi:phage/plasmid-like protein (TIGR03299 family)
VSHDLFSERFYSRRQNAWHGLGHISKEEDNAVNAFEKMGAYDVHLEDLVTASGMPIRQKAIIRDAVDGREALPLGIVGPEYHLVGPRTVCETWDRAVSQPVETLGALGQGETLFLSTRLPSINVKGDEVENYLLLVSPMTGAEAIRVRVTPVRVVCRNTLIAAKSMSSEVYRVIHDENAEKRLEMWLSGLIKLATERAALLNEMFVRFAEFKPTDSAVKRILDTTYPLPPQPRDLAGPETMEIRDNNWEINKATAVRSRAEVLEIWGGKGVGMDVPICRETAWGLYNAVCERSDYGNIRDKQLEARARDTLFGFRANEKERCFEAVQLELKRPQSHVREAVPA